MVRFLYQQVFRGGLLMNRLTRVGVAAALAAISVVASSQGAPNPDKTAIETRQGVFKLISNQFTPIGAALRGGAVSPEVAARNGERIKVLAGMIPELFERDTRQYKDVPTRALDGIWNSQADFKAKADGLASAADALMAAGKAGDKAAITAAAGNVGKACGACHDNFRAK
jgi:cytochrome c556